MSASEKLRALDEAKPPKSWSLGTVNLEYASPGTAAWLDAVLRALPALIAVVEAAETTAREHEAENPFVGYSIEALEAALAALDEKLGEP